MTRKTIAADELIWLFREELRKLGHVQGNMFGPSLDAHRKVT